MILGFSGYLIFGKDCLAYSIEEHSFTSSVRVDHWARIRENYEDYSPLCCIVRRFLLMTERGVSADGFQVMV
jgi:hypothetical protein